MNNELDNKYSSSEVNNGSGSGTSKTSSMRSESGKLDNVAFYVFLATIFLAPLAFWFSKYVPLELIKSLIINIGVLASAVLLAFVVLKEKKISLPPTSLCRTSVLLLVSIVISSTLSLHFAKSFFGQAFEVLTTSFLLTLFLAGLVTYNLIQKQRERAIVLYFAMVSSYLVLFLFHLLRVIFGESFLSFGIFTTPTSSILGSWYSLATLSTLVLIISISGLSFLQLSKRMKLFFSILAVISAIGIIFVADIRVWYVSAIVFLGLSIILFIEKWNKQSNQSVGLVSRTIKSLSFIPIVAFVISALLVYRGPAMLNSVVTKLNIAHFEIFLPWQTTLNVTSSVLQNYPLFGVGSNGFSDAYQAYKPLIINSTNAWGTEFQYGIGFVPTFIASHGVIGTILWILLFVFLGIFSTRIIRNLPDDYEKRFMILSSFTMMVFLWLMLFVTIPTHTIILLTFVITALFVSLAVAYGLVNQRVYSPVAGSKVYKVFPSLVSVLILIIIVGGLMNVKKILAFTYFARGLGEFETNQNLEKADQAFTTALKLNESDVYWRSKAEISIATAQKLASTITNTTSASTTQAVLTDINNVLNRGIADAKKATAYNPKNYYNYLSEARVAEVAASIKMANGYENALASYNSAISLNPYNPSLYLSLANFEAKNGKYDEAIKDLGRALQVKNNYLDAVFLLSQIYATKGDLQNAVIAAGIAVQLNPQNPVLLFQLGLLRYYAKDYNGSSQAFTEAIKYQADYANAKYFLGLSLARLGDFAKAIETFEDLQKTNDTNEEVALILSNLRSGRSIFTDEKIPVSTPEKRTGLPVKEKK